MSRTVTRQHQMRVMALRAASGETIRDISRSEDMPSERTLRRWLKHPDYRRILSEVVDVREADWRARLDEMDDLIHRFVWEDLRSMEPHKAGIYRLYAERRRRQDELADRESETRDMPEDVAADIEALRTTLAGADRITE